MVATSSCSQSLTAEGLSRDENHTSNIIFGQLEEVSNNFCAFSEAHGTTELRKWLLDSIRSFWEILKLFQSSLELLEFSQIFRITSPKISFGFPKSLEFLVKSPEYKKFPKLLQNSCIFITSSEFLLSVHFFSMFATCNQNR